MDALDLLAAQHQEAIALLERIGGAGDPAARGDLAREIVRKLTITRSATYA